MEHYFLRFTLLYVSVIDKNEKCGRTSRWATGIGWLGLDKTTHGLDEFAHALYLVILTKPLVAD